MEKSLTEITIEDIRRLPGYELLSDQQLIEIVEGIKEYTLIITDRMRNNKLHPDT